VQFSKKGEIMYQYVRFNKDGQEVFDFNELSLEQRANFIRDLELIAQDIEVDVDSAGASNEERALSIEIAARNAVVNALYSIDAEIDQDTKQIMVDRIMYILADRNSVEID
jgi:hypothetical protein